MNLQVKVGNIVNEPADVLVCSANICLNLSGGVGADLLERYGMDIQNELHSFIAARTPRCAMRGEIFESIGKTPPYKAILHAVAVDPFYQSSPQIVGDLVFRCLERSRELEVDRVALAALATGFGNLSLEQFAEGISRCAAQWTFDGPEIVVSLCEPDRVAELVRGFERWGLRAEHGELDVSL